MEYQIKVKSTKYRKAGSSWFRLRRFGLRPDRFGAYAGTVRSRRKLEKLRAYCEKKHLYFRLDNAYGRRGGSYRNIFFRTTRPVLGAFYFCAYCGKPMTRKHVTVDHLYPVGSAYKDPDMQEFLRKKHLSGLNDPKNLVAACRKCNQEKSSRMGEWIRRGRRGRHQWVWLLRHIIRIALAAAVILALGYLAAGLLHVDPGEAVKSLFL
ncbi:MAG: HNH endonuclease [Eubacterium sp.]|nr:HNH endonuclease [Eubacterium sp.]